MQTGSSGLAVEYMVAKGDPSGHLWNYLRPSELNLTVTA